MLAMRQIPEAQDPKLQIVGAVCDRPFLRVTIQFSVWPEKRAVTDRPYNLQFRICDADSPSKEDKKRRARETFKRLCRLLWGHGLGRLQSIPTARDSIPNVRCQHGSVHRPGDQRIWPLRRCYPIVLGLERRERPCPLADQYCGPAA